MTVIPSRNCWRAEGLKLWRQPLARSALALLLVLLMVTAVAAGLDARAWRDSAAQDGARHAALLEQAGAQLARLPPGPARAVASYQLGRGELGATRMPVEAGLVLGVQRLELLPVRLKASLDSRHVEARDPGPLRNPLLAERRLPGLPAMVALLLPLVALLLCAGLLQEEREQGRPALLRLQSRGGLRPVIVAALGWRLLALWAVAVLASLPAFLLDPGASAAVLLQWAGALALFCLVWVLLGGLLCCTPLSGAGCMLAALGLWLALGFVLPAVLELQAQQRAPMPSRLAAIVQIRAAQQQAEEHEAELARRWYAAHPALPARLPAVWPASFLPRVLQQDRDLQPMDRAFEQARLAQAEQVRRRACWSPGLCLVLFGERLAGTDAEAHARYRRRVADFEERWRQHLVPTVMDLRGLEPAGLQGLPGWGSGFNPVTGHNGLLQ